MEPSVVYVVLAAIPGDDDVSVEGVFTDKDKAIAKINKLQDDNPAWDYWWEEKTIDAD